jgi:hypothetical protein
MVDQRDESRVVPDRIEEDGAIVEPKDCVPFASVLFEEVERSRAVS